jgi:hypothetical protein
LLNTIDNNDLPVDKIIKMVKELRELDQASTNWRHGPGWTYKTLPHSEVFKNGAVLYNIPEFVQLHPDVWVAYEWNYHRTARIVLHEHLLECLSQFEDLSTDYSETFSASVHSLMDMDIGIIKTLVDEILSTVPQSLGDIDIYY